MRVFALYWAAFVGQYAPVESRTVVVAANDSAAAVAFFRFVTIGDGDESDYGGDPNQIHEINAKCPDMTQILFDSWKLPPA